MSNKNPRIVNLWENLTDYQKFCACTLVSNTILFLAGVYEAYSKGSFDPKTGVGFCGIAAGAVGVSIKEDAKSSHFIQREARKVSTAIFMPALVFWTWNAVKEGSPTSMAVCMCSWIGQGCIFAAKRYPSAEGHAGKLFSIAGVSVLGNGLQQGNPSTIVAGLLYTIGNTILSKVQPSLKQLSLAKFLGGIASASCHDVSEGLSGLGLGQFFRKIRLPSFRKKRQKRSGYRYINPG